MGEIQEGEGMQDWGLQGKLLPLSLLVAFFGYFLSLLTESDILFSYELFKNQSKNHPTFTN